MTNHLDPFVLRPTVMDVDLDALHANYAAIKRRIGDRRVMACVKANAYGHGIIACARKLEKCGVDALGVAFVEEGMALRNANVTVPILVLGGICGSQIEHFLRHDLSITASSKDKLAAINEAAQRLKIPAKVHIKIDTGMNRIGVRPSSSAALFEEALKCDSIAIEGVYSHFASSESHDLSFASLQLERFLEAVSFFEKRGLPCPPRHFANSGAVLQLPESYLDMVRPGLILYGLSPSEHLQSVLPLAPVGSLRSTVVYFKSIEKGEPVSYGSTWTAPARTRIVTVPIGYGDGYPRVLSNRGAVLIRGNRHAIVGRICMDQLMVDIGPDGTAYNGDEVVVMGASGNESIRAADIARLSGQSIYEITTGINQRVPRRYKEGEGFFF